MTGMYISPSCEIINLSPKAHYLQAASPYGDNGAAGGIFSGENTNDYSEDLL
ncbi:MAG: hypothetical protein KBS95_08245 [Alistipes sp.]|nr:hypothetical protein [Candidatus Alistipes equi]